MSESSESTRPGDLLAWTQDLTKNYNGSAAVDGIDLDIPRGQIMGLIGPSGAGKTTIAQLLTGVLAPTRGDAEVMGERPTGFRPADRARIGYMPQELALYPNLTVWENLSFFGAIYGLGWGRRKQMKRVLEFVDLADDKGKTVRQLSGGMKRRLSLAAALLHDPVFLVLDEPTAGIDPILRQRFWGHFRSLRDEGHTLLVTTQYVGEAAYCDVVAVLSAGKLVAFDSPHQLRRLAYGGERFTMRTEQPLSDGQRQELADELDVRIETDPEEDSHLILISQERGELIPSLVRWADDHQISLVSIDQRDPPFEEVFVRLLDDTRDEA